MSKRGIVLLGGLLAFTLGCSTPTPTPSVSPDVTTPSSPVASTPASPVASTPATTAPAAITFKAADGGTATCMSCHGEGTEMNNNLQNARDGWKTSSHALGIVEGTVGEGSDAFYANAGSCIRCHTKEGFLDFVNGKYDTNGKYDPLKMDPIGADGKADVAKTPVVDNPSSITCYACHKPHTTANFNRVVADDAAVTLLDGTVYKKSKGAICANCHQSRTFKKASDQIIDGLKTAALGARTNSHHSPAANIIMGTAGAEYTGKTYSSGAHKDIPDANCVSCHMTYPNARFGGSPGLAGHNFRIVGEVHAAELANPAGCVSCHPSAKALKVGATGAVPAKGHLVKDQAHVTIDGNLLAPNSTLVKFTALLDTIADPSKACDGLLNQAYGTADIGGAGKKITWSDQVNCTGPSFSVAADPAANENSPKVRFAKAFHNYLTLIEDKSFGAHNPTYALQLLNDSCEDLKSYTKSTVDCGVRP